MSKTKVIVIYGGKSAEHEISCRSAAYILKNLDPELYDVDAIAIDSKGRWLPQNTQALLQDLGSSVPIEVETIQAQPALPATNDPGSRLLSLVPHGLSSSENTVIIPILHGTNGEDGTMQGMLELAGVAYVGANHLASAIGMDKVVSKKLVAAAGVPVVPWVDFRRGQWQSGRDELTQRCLDHLKFPMFVKPVNCGSSVGITKVTEASKLAAAIDMALEFDDKVMIENGLNVREIECAALGGFQPEISIPGEVIPTADYYSYDAKYIDADGATIAIPAKLSNEQIKTAQALSRKIFSALELYGMARIDLFLDKDSDEFYFNEVNTIPGFTEISQFPLLWQASGMTAKELLNRLVELALERAEMKRRTKTDRL